MSFIACLLFGPFYFLFHGKVLTALVWVLTFPVSWLVAPFFAKRIVGVATGPTIVINNHPVQ